MEKDELIYGLRPVIEALEAEREIEKVLIQNGLKSELLPVLRQRLASVGVPYQFVPSEKLNRVCRANHQGVIAYISPVRYATTANVVQSVFDRGEIPLLLILDRITDVRNIGAIARSAECFGVHALIVPMQGAARIGSDAMKTSAGALNRIPVCREASLIKAIEYLRESGLQIAACTEKGGTEYHLADFTLPTAIIFGSEEDGIGQGLLKASDVAVKIRTTGHTLSLNVSVAAGILLAETSRQRTKP